MPTSATTTWTAQKLEPFLYPDRAERIAVKLAPSLTLAKGTVLGRNATTNLWGAYVDAGATDPARAILGIDTATDASGNHFYGTQASSEYGEAHLHTWAFISGDFKAADLTGLDANGQADLRGSLVYGDNLADAEAVIHIG